MSEALALALDNLLSPMVLFFLLGLLATLLRSDLEIPPAIGKALSLYLMLAIGFKGGAEIARTGFDLQFLSVAVVALVASFLLPFLAFAILRTTTRLGIHDAAAVSAHYGSVSVVTFVTATAFLTQAGVAYAGFFVAVLALMESPAIVAGVLLARGRSGEPGKPLFSGHVLREVLVGSSIFLLAGSLLIGAATGEKGLETMRPLIVDPFKAVLSIFLLDMGLIVARRLQDFRAVGAPLVAFGIYMPLVGAAVGLTIAFLVGLGASGATLLAVLFASASYIAVPAAMRQAIPEANPSIYVTLSLGVSFPFNVIVGIPLYYALARALFPL